MRNARVRGAGIGRLLELVADGRLPGEQEEEDTFQQAHAAARPLAVSNIIQARWQTCQVITRRGVRPERVRQLCRRAARWRHSALIGWCCMSSLQPIKSLSSSLRVFDRKQAFCQLVWRAAWKPGIGGDQPEALEAPRPRYMEENW